MAESSRLPVVWLRETSLPEVGEVSHQHERDIFQDASSASPKLSVALFKDLGLISGSGYTTSQLQTLAFCHTCVTAIKTGKTKIAGNVKDSAFIYNGLHFPKMKLASEKPLEAVLEGVIFLGEHAPRPPYIMDFH